MKSNRRSLNRGSARTTASRGRSIYGRDVSWHDGAPFTAHDVEFTFNRIVYNDDIDSSDRDAFTFRYISEETGEWTEGRMTVTAPDDYTVQFVLPVPFAPFLRSMGNAVYPKHILEPYVDAGTFEDVWDINADPSEVIGTGPFTIAQYAPGNSLTLRRNPGYWMKDSAGNSLPYVDESRVPHRCEFRGGAGALPGRRGGRARRSGRGVPGRSNRCRRRGTSRSTGAALVSAPRSWHST